MVLSKLRQFCCLSFVIAILLNVSGCVELSTFTSTDEYIPSEEMIEQADVLEYQTAEVYEDTFTLDFQEAATIKYTITRELYWENPQDLYGELLVAKGDYVKKGDVLATFVSSQNDEIAILERELSVEQARASLNQVIQTYENLIAAQKENLTRLTGEEYELAYMKLEEMEYEYAYRLLEGEHRVAMQQEALDEVLKTQETKELVAPFDGKIVSVSSAFQTGYKIGNGVPIIKISDVESRRMVLKETRITKQANYLSPVTITDPYTKETYNGTIVSCPEVTGQEQSSTMIRLDDELQEEQEGVEYLVSGCIYHKEKATLVDSHAVKTETLMSGNKVSYVYVLNENNAKYKVCVKVGAVFNNVTWIIEGLEPGQRVIVE